MEEIDLLLEEGFEYIAIANESKVKTSKAAKISEYAALTSAVAIFSFVIQNCHLVEDDVRRYKYICDECLFRKKIIEAILMGIGSESNKAEIQVVESKCKEESAESNSPTNDTGDSDVPTLNAFQTNKHSFPSKDDLLTDPDPNVYKKLCGNKKIFNYLKLILLGNRIQSKFTENWAELKPKSVLLAGVPGNGKTLLIEALASFMNYKIIKVTSAVLKDMFHGNSEKMMIHIFKIAKEYKNCFIMFDEIDLILRKRGDKMDSVDDGIFNCFNIMMDDLERLDTNVIVFGATNRPKALDPAVIKRFFVRLLVENPDRNERMDMIKSQLQPCKLDDEQLHLLADFSNGWSFCAIKQTIGELIIESYLTDLKSSYFKEDKSNGCFYACQPNDAKAKKLSICDLPVDSLRARPLTYCILHKRFEQNKNRKGLFLQEMSKELKTFNDEYCSQVPC